MEVRLKVLVGKSAGQELLIPGPKFFIGRAEDCQLRPRSDLISRHHCALLVEDGFLAIRDFGSKNGTLVNGERVAGERELKAGDKLTVGPLEFEVCVLATTAAKKRPKVESVKEAAARTAEGASDNIDVSQWLTDKDKEGSTETRVINVNETSEIDLSSKRDASASTSLSGENLDGQARETVEATAEKAEAGKAAPDKKRTPGKLPPIPPKSGNLDTGGAAADVLNKFFKRR
ncbi:MAG TPA: FHA domain-containing protein [Pirellulales bacterium]|nr:FHA domain-containing protein [Pirellulales bacterium]